MTPKTLSAAFVILVLIQIAAALAFAFTGHYTDHGFDCRELMSSGNDDEVMMMLFVALLASVSIRLFRFRTSPNAAEVVVYIAIMIVCALFASVTNGCGDPVSTLLAAEPSFLVFVASGISAALTMTLLVRSKAAHNHNESVWYEIDDGTETVLTLDEIEVESSPHPRRRTAVLKRPDGFFTVAEQYYYSSTYDGIVIAEGWATLLATGIFSSIEIAADAARAELEKMRSSQS